MFHDLFIGIINFMDAGPFITVPSLREPPVTSGSLLQCVEWTMPLALSLVSGTSLVPASGSKLGPSQWPLNWISGSIILASVKVLFLSPAISFICFQTHWIPAACTEQSHNRVLSLWMGHQYQRVVSVDPHRTNAQLLSSLGKGRPTAQWSAASCWLE